MKKIIYLLLLVTASYALTACNTMRGLGQDVSKVGEKMQEGANK